MVSTSRLCATIKGIKEQLRAIPGKGLGYGLLRYLGSPAQRQALAALPKTADDAKKAYTAAMAAAIRAHFVTPEQGA